MTPCRDASFPCRQSSSRGPRGIAAIAWDCLLFRRPRGRVEVLPAVVSFPERPRRSQHPDPARGAVLIRRAPDHGRVNPGTPEPTNRRRARAKRSQGQERSAFRCSGRDLRCDLKACPQASLNGPLLTALRGLFRSPHSVSRTAGVLTYRDRDPPSPRVEGSAGRVEQRPRQTLPLFEAGLASTTRRIASEASRTLAPSALTQPLALRPATSSRNQRGSRG